jgi:hypothetical protein
LVCQLAFRHARRILESPARCNRRRHSPPAAIDGKIDQRHRRAPPPAPGIGRAAPSRRCQKRKSACVALGRENADVADEIGGEKIWSLRRLFAAAATKAPNRPDEKVSVCVFSFHIRWA